MKTRVISAIVFACIFIPAIIFGGVYFLIVTTFCTVVATYELLNCFGKENEFCNKLKFVIPAFSAILAILFYMQGKYANAYTLLIDNGSLVLHQNLEVNANMFWIFSISILLAYILFVIIILITCTLNKSATMKDSEGAITALTYGGLLFCAAFSLEYVKPIVTNGEGINILNFIFKYVNGKIFLFVYGVIAMSDIFALLVGRKFGKNKLSPEISPNKTIEGAVGGFIISSMLGVLFAYLLDILPMDKESSVGFIIICLVASLLISALISILEQIGDLVASKFKRQYGIKDYGNIMPGHGGIMDRFDSTVLVGASLYFVIFLFKIISIGVLG